MCAAMVRATCGTIGGSVLVFLVLTNSTVLRWWLGLIAVHRSAAVGRRGLLVGFRDGSSGNCAAAGGEGEGVSGVVAVQSIAILQHSSVDAALGAVVAASNLGAAHGSLTE
ncbi:hypothetical protein ON010_g17844 [Phytophthora cinnamomi]|nr:hypothetical protein ON010_g17844 [Phytophthora cinnamomi]